MNLLIPRTSTSFALLTSMLAASCGPKAESTDASQTDASISDTAPASSTPTTTNASEPGDVTTGACEGLPATSTAGLGVGAECPDHPGVDACCCFDPHGQNQCDVHLICQELALGCADDGTMMEPCPASDLRTSCPEAIDCALSALANNQVGTIQWKIYTLMGFEVAQVHIVGDGTAYVSNEIVFDTYCARAAVRRMSLKDASSFALCTENPSVIERFECVRQPFLAAAIETCTPEQECPGDL